MSYWLAAVSSILIASVVALLLTAWQAWRMASARHDQGFRNGPWMTRFSYGSREMSLCERAFVAIAGLWALQSSEVVYFTAFRDSDGRRLDFRNNYRIEGHDPEARWWVITVYKNFHFIPNERNRYSYSKTNIVRQDDDTWTINLSTQPRDENWIPLGKKRGLVAISLRLYNPRQVVYENPVSLALPRIIREPTNGQSA